jgi:hypothetical protein
MNAPKKKDKDDKEPKNGNSSCWIQLEFPFVEQIDSSGSGKSRRKGKK